MIEGGGQTAVDTEPLQLSDAAESNVSTRINSKQGFGGRARRSAICVGASQGPTSRYPAVAPVLKCWTVAPAPRTTRVCPSPTQTSECFPRCPEAGRTWGLPPGLTWRTMARPQRHILPGKRAATGTWVLSPGRRRIAWSATSPVSLSLSSANIPRSPCLGSSLPSLLGSEVAVQHRWYSYPPC